MTVPHINRIGSAVPPHDVHAAFVAFARTLLPDDKTRSTFDRMSERAGIAHRWSDFRPGDLGAGEVDADHFFRRGAFPGTAARMALYEQRAPALARRACADIVATEGDRLTHLVVASCTGFTAPTLDLQLMAALGLPSTIERTLVGFMGCSAAVPALRSAYHIVRSQPDARVLVVNCELSSLHMKESADVATVLSFLLFGDGASAALVTADPHGLALDGFASHLLPDSKELITWHIADDGFDMHLSGQVPSRIAAILRGPLGGGLRDGVDVWAVHAGGRTVLDAVEIGLGLDTSALRPSRDILAANGNMSSATVMFVLQQVLRDAQHGACGQAMAFGPGVVAETFRFHVT